MPFIRENPGGLSLSPGTWKLAYTRSLDTCSELESKESLRGKIRSLQLASDANLGIAGPSDDNVLPDAEDLAPVPNQNATMIIKWGWHRFSEPCQFISWRRGCGDGRWQLRLGRRLKKCCTLYQSFLAVYPIWSVCNITPADCCKYWRGWTSIGYRFVEGYERLYYQHDKSLERLKAMTSKVHGMLHVGQQLRGFGPYVSCGKWVVSTTMGLKPQWLCLNST